MERGAEKPCQNSVKIFPEIYQTNFQALERLLPHIWRTVRATETITNKIDIKAKIVSLAQFIAKPRLEQRQVSAAAEVNRTSNGRNGFRHQLCWEKSSTYRFSYQNPSILHSLKLFGEGATKERL
jgi:hypothetical protein